MSDLMRAQKSPGFKAGLVGNPTLRRYNFPVQQISAAPSAHRAHEIKPHTGMRQGKRHRKDDVLPVESACVQVICKTNPAVQNMAHQEGFTHGRYDTCQKKKNIYTVRKITQQFADGF